MNSITARARSRPLTGVAICGGGLVFASAMMSWLSQQFAFETGGIGRPLITFVTLMSVMFVIHWVAFRIAMRIAPAHQLRLVLTIWIVALLSRLVLLPSHPIQEVDLYRYLWDGQVTVAGVNPFRYRPATVIDSLDRATGPEDLGRLTQLAASNRSVEIILRRVHFGELPTVYPAVSQAVFAVVAALTPAEASLHVHVVAMKTAMVVFDLGVLGLLGWLLRMVGRSQAWSITYGWCPLVLKEFAGSGHLDSIAVCLTMGSLVVSVLALRRGSRWGWFAAAVLLALAFGSKLYPVVVFPVLLVACVRSSGWRSASIAVAGFALTGMALLLPTLLVDRPIPSVAEPRTLDQIDSIEPPIPPPEQPFPEPAERQMSISEADRFKPASAATASRSTEGLEAFLTRWEMNDLIFLVLVENLRPGDRGAWFAISTEAFRNESSDRLAGWWNVAPDVAAFVAARLITFGVFLLFTAIVIRRIDASDPASFCRAAFLVQAVFWMLSPTLNPWYWSWALPLVAFAKSRGWLLVAGLLPIYYLRFWFAYHPEAAIASWFPYQGVTTFDFVVVFFEHLPWLLLLAIEAARSSGKLNQSSIHGRASEPSR